MNFQPASPFCVGVVKPVAQGLCLNWETLELEPLLLMVLSVCSQHPLGLVQSNPTQVPLALHAF